MAMIDGNRLAMSGLGATKVYDVEFNGKLYHLDVEVDENGAWIAEDLTAKLTALRSTPDPGRNYGAENERRTAAANLEASNRWSAEVLRVQQETAAKQKKLDDALAQAEKSLADAKALEDKAKESKSAADIATADAAKIKAANDKAAADKAAIDLAKAKADSAGNNKSLIDGVDNKTLLMIAAGLAAAVLLSKK